MPNDNPGIPILLYCPGCHERHIDRLEWSTRPHHTHACQLCGTVWRPAVVNTVGVAFLPGFKDIPPEFEKSDDFGLPPGRKE